MVADGEKVAVGNPVVEDAKVTATAKENGKGDKVIVFKYKAKVRYRRKNGHRQQYTRLSIDSISAPGIEKAKPAKAPATAKAEKAAKAAATAKAKKPAKAATTAKAEKPTKAATTVKATKPTKTAVAKATTTKKTTRSKKKEETADGA